MPTTPTTFNPICNMNFLFIFCYVMRPTTFNPVYNMDFFLLPFYFSCILRYHPNLPKHILLRLSLFNHYNSCNVQKEKYYARQMSENCAQDIKKKLLSLLSRPHLDGETIRTKLCDPLASGQAIHEQCPIYPLHTFLEVLDTLFLTQLSNPPSEGVSLLNTTTCKGRSTKQVSDKAEPVNKLFHPFGSPWFAYSRDTPNATFCIWWASSTIIFRQAPMNISLEEIESLK